MTTASTKTCPSCAEEIKADAKKCKHCNSMVDGKPIVIERTDKTYKGRMLNGLQMIGVAIVLIFIKYDMNIITTIGSWLVVEIAWFLVAKYTAWWNHG